MEFYLVRAKDSVYKVTKLAFKKTLNDGEFELQAIGNDAVRTAVKSGVNAVGKIFNNGSSAICIPKYGQTQIDGKNIQTVTVRCKII